MRTKGLKKVLNEKISKSLKRERVRQSHFYNNATQRENPEKNKTNRRSRTNPHIIGYRESINRKKKEINGLNDGCETIESVGKRNSTFIFGRKGRQLGYYPILETYQSGLPGLIWLGNKIETDSFHLSKHN
jgi:hypothetical protein